MIWVFHYFHDQFNFHYLFEFLSLVQIFEKHFFLIYTGTWRDALQANACRGTWPVRVRFLSLLLRLPAFSFTCLYETKDDVGDDGDDEMEDGGMKVVDTVYKRSFTPFLPLYPSSQGWNVQQVTLQTPFRFVFYFSPSSKSLTPRIESFKSTLIEIQLLIDFLDN